MFNMNIDNFQKHDVEDSYAPITAGTYQAIISESSVNEGVTGATSKHPNKQRTLIKVRFDVYNAKQDGGSRPYFHNYLVAHEASASDETIANMCKRNENEVFELVRNIIMTNYGGNSQQSPFASGFNPNTVPYLANHVVTLELGINKRNENYIKKLVEEQPQQAPVQQAQQPMQQAPVGNGQQQPQYMNAPNTQTAAVKQNAASPSNPNFANGNLPPFATQQRAS